MPFDVVQWLFSNLAKLLPWRMIFSYERGVRWTWGKNPKSLLPGIRWCMYLMHRVESFSVVEQVINLPTQSVMTGGSNPKAVCFSVNVGIEIVDPVRHYCEVQNFDQSVRDLAMSHLAERVRTRTFEQLAAEGGLRDLETSLEGTLSTRLREWGTKVTRVGFTDFVPVRSQFRIFQDQAAGKTL